VEAPRAFLESLRLVDPNLFPDWNSRTNRWVIRLRNPRKPSHPPVSVKVVAEKDGSFRPLDNRTIDWLLQSDLQRRFHGYREDQLGHKLDEALRAEEEVLEKERTRKANDRWDEVMDKAHFEYRRLERQGKI
jgi:hypothetical protein